MKKLMVSGALALALSGVAMAEESGGFVGVDLGLASLTKMESDLQNTYALGNLRYGLVGGYKWFFTQSVGLRAYLAVNNGTNYMQDTTAGNQFNTLNVMANIDFLNTFYNSEQVSAGWFAGVSLGYAIHNGGIVKAQVDFLDQAGVNYNPSGFDMGINFGVRTIFAKHHGIEFFNRFGVIGASNSYNLGIENKEKILQPYAFGVRYTFNF